MKISYRHNVMSINSIDAFLNVKGGYNNNLRDVYFVRGIGEPANIKDLIFDIDRKMDDASRSGKLSYLRVADLPKLESKEQIDFYSKNYDMWDENGGVELKCCEANPSLTDVVSDATKAAVDLYKEIKTNSTKSMEKNFVVKLWFWLDSLFLSIFSTWNERSCIKVLADNVVNVQEYLFYYMLTLFGCDVLLIESRKDIQADNRLTKLSVVLKLGEYGLTAIPQYVKTELSVSRQPQEKVRVTIPEHVGRRTVSRPVPQPSQSSNEHRTMISSSGQSTNAGGSEKSFEELALLASSIVMISVHDNTGEPIATGSGIMIGRDGYILTNNHVVRGGCFFSIRIEDDEEIYPTDEVIKYNTVLDLAVLRIDRTLNPIPIYNGSQKLVRGQKVVAIGSPLGLFNSVSDGIISGFRKIQDVDMIQFTAPTSHGSSGGAVLNMQGEVIGISTAGIDNGQNINLAVGYESIKMFARGFF